MEIIPVLLFCYASVSSFSQYLSIISQKSPFCVLNLDFFIFGIHNILLSLSTNNGYLSLFSLGIFLSIKTSFTFFLPFKPLISIKSPSLLFLIYIGNFIFFVLSLHISLPSVSISCIFSINILSISLTSFNYSL